MLLRPLTQQLGRLSLQPARTRFTPLLNLTRIPLPRYKMSDAAATQAPPAAAAGDAPNLQKDPETGEMVSKS